jgi:hypothetical protein
MSPPHRTAGMRCVLCGLADPDDACHLSSTDTGLPLNVHRQEAKRTVRDFRQQFTLEDTIGSHVCSLEALTCV